VSTLISEEYRQLNGQLHQTNDAYGRSGHKWAADIRELANICAARTILDYACGKATLASALADKTVICYDPCMPQFSDLPDPADLVVGSDFLEHVEPDCLEAVLDDLQRLTLKAVFLVVATRPAKKILADGRNAHLIQEPYSWWLPKIMHRWTIQSFANYGGEFVVMGSKQ